MLDRVHLWNIASVTSLSDNFFKFELNTYCLSAPYVQQGSLQGPASTVRQMMEVSHLHGKLRKSNCNYASPILHIFSRSSGLPEKKCFAKRPPSQAPDQAGSREVSHKVHFGVYVIQDS